jgi:hypothetical protein
MHLSKGVVHKYLIYSSPSSSPLSLFCLNFTMALRDKHVFLAFWTFFCVTVSVMGLPAPMNRDHSSDDFFHPANLARIQFNTNNRSSNQSGNDHRTESARFGESSSLHAAATQSGSKTSRHTTNHGASSHIRSNLGRRNTLHYDQGVFARDVANTVAPFHHTPQWSGMNVQAGAIPFGHPSPQDFLSANPTFHTEDVTSIVYGTGEASYNPGYSEHQYHGVVSGTSFGAASFENDATSSLQQQPQWDPPGHTWNHSTSHPYSSSSASMESIPYLDPQQYDPALLSDLPSSSLVPMHHTPNRENLAETVREQTNTSARSYPVRSVAKEHSLPRKDVPIQTTFPVTELGFEWSTGMEICYGDMFNAHKNMMINVVYEITRKNPNTIRLQLRTHLTPPMAHDLLSGDTRRCRSVIKYIWPKFIFPEEEADLDAWKTFLNPALEERLCRDLCQITSQSETYIKSFLTRRVTAEKALEMSLYTPEQLVQFAMDWGIIHKTQVRKIVKEQERQENGEDVMTQVSNANSTWKLGTTKSGRKRIVDTVNAVYNQRPDSRYAYDLMTRTDVRQAPSFGPTLLQMAETQPWEDVVSYVVSWTGVTPKHKSDPESA